MASPLSRKRKSPEPDHDVHNEYASTTPAGSPPRKKLRITRRQKQALIDNLQLEITERARKLRAQYALQAQDLRARLERRINRIPVALRKVTMGELLERYNAAVQAEQAAPSPFKKPLLPLNPVRSATTISGEVEKRNPPIARSPARGVRRISDEGALYSDKENAPAPTDKLDVLEIPKKRVKPGATTGPGPSRAVSQAMREAEAKILSPKSSNSRTYPHSPLKNSPEKQQHHLSYMSRPASPLKPSSPLKATPVVAGTVESARARSTKGTATTATKDNKTPSQPKKTATRPAAKTAAASVKSPRLATHQQQDRRISTGTTASNVSSGTTIVKSSRTAATTKKTGTATSTSASATKKTTVARSQAATATSAAKKTTAAAAKKAAATTAAEPAAAGRRVLRKRA
ncbi:Borealin N terminal-domain-containing protein [Thermoascus aurantiacus ATCC 26904]